MTPSREARIATLAAANHARHQSKRAAVDAAINSLRKENERITVSAVATRAKVSRNFIYNQSELLQQIQAAGAEQSGRMMVKTNSSTEASLRIRLADALDVIRGNKRVIEDQKATIERLTGELARRVAAETTA